MRVEARRDAQGRSQKFRLVGSAPVRKVDRRPIVRKFIVAGEASMEKGRDESGADVRIRLRIYPHRAGLRRTSTHAGWKQSSSTPRRVDETAYR